MYLTQTTGNVFIFFCFATERFTTYNVPTPLAVPLGLLVASDGKVYNAELVGNKILVSAGGGLTSVVHMSLEPPAGSITCEWHRLTFMFTRAWLISA